MECYNEVFLFVLYSFPRYFYLSVCGLVFLTSLFKLQDMEEKIFMYDKVVLVKNHVCKHFPVKVQVLVENLNVENVTLQLTACYINGLL